jgi:hypothetical protein
MAPVWVRCMRVWWGRSSACAGHSARSGWRRLKPVRGANPAHHAAWLPFCEPIDDRWSFRPTTARRSRAPANWHTTKLCRTNCPPGPGARLASGALEPHACWRASQYRSRGVLLDVYRTLRCRLPCSPSVNRRTSCDLRLGGIRAGPQRRLLPHALCERIPIEASLLFSFVVLFFGVDGPDIAPVGSAGNNIVNGRHGR